MKTKLLLTSLLIAFTISIQTNAQNIQNGGFEQWNAGAPVHWTSTDFLDITQTTDKASGVYAAKMKDVTGDLISYFTTTSALGAGEKPTFVTCYFKFGILNPGDWAAITVSLIDSNYPSGAPASIQQFSTNITSYTPITMSFFPSAYTITPNPTHIKIAVELFCQSGIAGAEFFVDDFMYGGGNVAGVDDLDLNNQINIFPNPSSGFINVVSEKENIQSITIYNTFGQMVYSKEKPMMTTLLDISNLSNGFYVVKVATDKGISDKRIVIAK